MTSIQDSFNADLEEAKRRVQAGIAAGVPSMPVHPPDAVADAPPPGASKLPMYDGLYGTDLAKWTPTVLKAWLKEYKAATSHDALAGVVKPTTGDLMRIVAEAKARLAGMPTPPAPPAQGQQTSIQLPPPPTSTHVPPPPTAPPAGVSNFGQVPPTPATVPSVTTSAPLAPIPASAERPVYMGATVLVQDAQGAWRQVTIDGRQAALGNPPTAASVLVLSTTPQGAPSWLQTGAFWPPGSVGHAVPTPQTAVPAGHEGRYPDLPPVQVAPPVPPTAPAPAAPPGPPSLTRPDRPLQIGDEVAVTGHDGNLRLLKIDGQSCGPVPGSNTHVYVQGYDAQRQPAWLQIEVYWPTPRPALPPAPMAPPAGTGAPWYNAAGEVVPAPPGMSQSVPAGVSNFGQVAATAPSAPPVSGDVNMVVVVRSEMLGPPNIEPFLPPSGNGQEGVSNFGQVLATSYRGGPDHQPDMRDPEQNPRLAGPPSGDSLVGGILRDHLGYDLFVDVIPSDRKWVDVLDLAQPTIAYWNAQLDKQKPPKGTEGQVGHYQLFEWQGGIGLVVGGVLNCVEQFQGLNIVVRTRTALGKALAEALAPRARERFEGVR